MCERNIDQLPPTSSLTEDRTDDPLVHGMMLQPTEHWARATILMVSKAFMTSSSF